MHVPVNVNVSRWSSVGVGVLLSLLLSARASGEFTVRSEVDAQKIGVQDQLQLTITVSGTSLPDEAPTPAFVNLQVVAGPSVVNQTSFVAGAGGMRTESSLVYVYVLQPLKPGPAEVSEVRMNLGAASQAAPAIPIEVVAGSVRPRSSPPADPWDPFGGGEDPMDSIFRRRRARGPEPKLFIEATLSRDRVFVGEPVLLTCHLYTQLSVTDLQWGEPPKYAGFWSEELPKPTQPPGGEPVRMNGEVFRRFALFQKLLFPTKAGTATVPPLTLKLGVQSGGGFFDIPTRGVVERATRPVTLAVEAIPEEPGFSGAVGRFSAQATLDKASVALGEAATLRFEVHGNGNLKWIDRGPELNVPGAKVYPPQVSSDLKATTSGITGTKSWEFVVVPATSGAITVPALTFSYFDPEKRRMARTETPAMAMNVRGASPGAAAPSLAAPSGLRAGAPLALRSDLDLPLRTAPALSSTALAGIVGLVLVIHGALWASPWLRDRRETSGRSRGRRGVRRALADLERAGRDGMSKEASVAHIEKTLHDVFGPMEDDTTPPETERERAARDVLQEVYFIRYAPQLGDYSEQIRSVARRAAEVVRKWS